MGPCEVKSSHHIPLQRCLKILRGTGIRSLLSIDFLNIHYPLKKDINAYVIFLQQHVPFMRDVVSRFDTTLCTTILSNIHFDDGSSICYLKCF